MPEIKPIGPTTLKELGDYEGVSPASFKKIIDTCPSPPPVPTQALFVGGRADTRHHAPTTS